MVEQSPLKRMVTGSNPVGGTVSLGKIQQTAHNDAIRTSAFGTLLRQLLRSSFAIIIHMTQSGTRHFLALYSNAKVLTIILICEEKIFLF